MLSHGPCSPCSPCFPCSPRSLCPPFLSLCLCFFFLFLCLFVCLDFSQGQARRPPGIFKPSPPYNSRYIAGLTANLCLFRIISSLIMQENALNPATQSTTIAKRPPKKTKKRQKPRNPVNPTPTFPPKTKRTQGNQTKGK